MGSLDESATRDGLASARYALMRDREWRSESSIREVTQSSQPHLEKRENERASLDDTVRGFCLIVQTFLSYRTSCGMGSVAPRSSRILIIS